MVTELLQEKQGLNLMEEIFSVSTLTEAIKKRLESSFPSIQVQGEVSNLKTQASGHFYFTLKDNQSQISAVLFRGYAKDLSRPLRDGDLVVVQGEINVYPPRGHYQLIARSLKFAGVGELLLRLHALKAKLEAQGWFSATHKKPLPSFPRTIGVVTSSTGAVIQDILHILNRRVKGFHLVLYPVKVQGEGSAEEIAKAIEEMNRYKLADVLIVGRGGGSLEDLWAFNEERVASAIYHSIIPIISAVGHETDFSIADFVADVRAPTPSAAAEIVSAETARQIQFLTQSKQRLTSTVRTLVEQARRQLQQIKRDPLFTSPFSLIEPYFQQLDDASSGLDRIIQNQVREKQWQLLALKKQATALKPDNQVTALKEKLTVLSDSLTRAILQSIHTKQNLLNDQNPHRRMAGILLQKTTQMRGQLDQLMAHLKGINPKNLLKQGYCILFHENSSSVILSVQDLKKEDKIRLQLDDGQALVTVNEIKP